MDSNVEWFYVAVFVGSYTVNNPMLGVYATRQEAIDTLNLVYGEDEKIRFLPEDDDPETVSYSNVIFTSDSSGETQYKRFALIKTYVNEHKDHWDAVKGN